MVIPSAADFRLHPHMLDRISKGEAILFLGSGASLASVDSEGIAAPSGTGLRDGLCDEFLGGQAKDRPLAAVGDLVRNQAGVIDMQRFISERLENLLPSKGHLIIPKFRWKAIITTNYDLLIEKAYENETGRIQTVRPIISDDDQIGPVISNPHQYVPLMKLHGCISRRADAKLPFILSSWEYAKFRDRRARLFDYLKDWGREYPILFCGYSIADENVRDILFELSDPQIARPHYSLVNKGLLDIDRAMWGERRIDAVPGTFDILMSYLDGTIDSKTRKLGSAFKGASGSLSRFIPGKEAPSEELAAYLREHLLHVDQAMAAESVKAVDFYRGQSTAWGWLTGDLDIYRRVTDELVLNAVIENESKIPAPQLHLILGYAGSGKSVSLMRFCWQASTVQGKPIFFLRPEGTLKWEMILELHALLRDTVFIAVDDVIQQIEETANAIKMAKKAGVPLVIIGGARTNEWNVEGASLAPFVKQPYDLLDLSDEEIKALVSRLRKHSCLGYMKDFDEDEAAAYLKSKLDHQLLVALHEATSGVSFAETIADEYTHIVPTQAQKLYLDICTVHRVGVAVRAGTISRVSDIRLEEFNRRLFKPLEHVVHTVFDRRVGDYVYKTRHPKIAAMVFDVAAPNEGLRSSQIVRLIGNMNAGYSTDEEAIIRLIRAKDLARDFPDNREMAYPIFRAARLAGISEETFCQHVAHFEMIHKKGDLKKAYTTIEQAVISAGSRGPSKSTLHVKTMILRRMARETATTEVEKDKRRQEARVILDRLMADKRDPHPFNTKADLLLDELDERLNAERAQADKLVADLIKDIQVVLAASRQLFPRDSFIASIEARYATIMNRHPKATAILEQAHKAEPHSQYIALQLSEKLRSEGRAAEAVAVLQATLKAVGPNKDIHLSLAEALRQENEHGNSSRISAHLRSSFHDGGSSVPRKIPLREA